MTTRKDISLNVIADISKYQEQFAKIPGFTEKQAAKAASALEKKMSKAAADSARSAERAAAKSAAAFRKAGEGPSGLAASLDGIAEKSGDVDSIVAGLGGALGAIDPKLQAVATGFQDAAGGLEAVAKGGLLSIPALATVGIAVVALGAAYLVLAEDVEEAERKQEAAAIKATAAQAAFLGFGEAIRSLDLEIRKLSGTYDENGEAFAKRERQFAKQSELATDFLQTQIESEKAERSRLAVLQSQGDASDETMNKMRTLDGRISKHISQLEGVQKRTREFGEQSEMLAEFIDLSAKAKEKDTKATEDNKRAQEDAANASKARAEALRMEKDAQDAMDRAMGKAATIIERDAQLRKQNTAIILSTTQHEMTALGKAARAREDQLRKLREIEDQRIANASGNQELITAAEVAGRDARLAVETQFEEEKTRILAEQSDERIRITEQEGKEIGNRLREFTVTTLGAMNEALTGMSQLAAESGSKRQARNLFRLGKATAAALTVVNTIASAQRAVFDLGPILGPVAATAITAAGFARVALIRNQKMPQFYRGTSNVQPSGGSRDAVPAMLHEGEAVLNRRAAQSMGRSQIEALNASGRSGSQTVVAISQVNHRQFRDFYRDDRQLPGSLTRGDRNRSGTTIGRQL